MGHLNHTKERSKREIDVPQHIRHNKEPHVTSTDVDLVEMRNTAVARCDSNIFHLDVHVVLRYSMSVLRHNGCQSRTKRTLEEFSAVDDAGVDFESDDVALQVQ